MKAFRVIALSFSCSLLCAFAAHAQMIPTVSDSLSLSLSSNNPSPGQTVTVTAQSFSIDLNSANITWASNGKTTAQGIGLNTLQVQAPALGKKMSITVTAVAQNGRTITGAITLDSGTIDLIVENSGYVPPFFLGKIATAYQNISKIVAVPHLANSKGVEYDPKTLVYSWQKDGQALLDQSGYGDQSVTLANGIVPRPFTVNVTVSTRDGTARTSGSVTVDSQSPSILFYVNDPLYGPLYNRAIGDTLRIGSQKEAGVIAAPYGFDTPAGNVSLPLSWLINGEEHPELNSGYSVTLRAPDGQAGTSNISLNITNDQKVLQSAFGSFVVNFSANSSAQGTSSSIVF